MRVCHNADRPDRDQRLASRPGALHRASLFAAIVPMRRHHADSGAQTPLRSRNSLMTSEIFISRESIFAARRRMTAPAWHC